MHREVADEEAGSLRLFMIFIMMMIKMKIVMMIKMVKMEIVTIIKMIDMVSL